MKTRQFVIYRNFYDDILVLGVLVHLHAIITKGLKKLKSKSFLAIVTNWLFLSFCESIFKPKAVLAITSIVNRPADLK